MVERKDQGAGDGADDVTPKAMVQARIWHARCRKGKYGYVVMIGGHHAGLEAITVRWMGSKNMRSARGAWQQALVALFAEELTK